MFTERCLDLLTPDGLLGFIMPHKFWQAKYGGGLRKIIADGQHLRSVVDFAHNQVFEGATTYTAIQVLSKESLSTAIDYARIDELSDGAAQCKEIDDQRTPLRVGAKRFQIEQLPRGNGPFRFAPKHDFAANGIVRPLGEVANLAQGFKTGADKVFVVELVETKAELTLVRSSATLQSHWIESESLCPLVKSEHMKPFEIKDSRLRLIMPYAHNGTKWALLNPKEMRERFPKLTQDYLVPLRSTLALRESGRFDGERFYQYSRPQNFAALGSPKIISPDICEHPQMGWDASGEFKFSGGAAGGVAIVPSSAVSPFFLLGLLNSRFADYWIRTNGTPFRGGYLNCEIRFIRDFPVFMPETAEHKKLAKMVDDSANAITKAKHKLRSNKLSDRERQSLESDIENLARRIDQAVLDLYGIDSLPD